MAEPIIVTTPDGQEFEFPAGTSQEAMKSAMQKHFGKPPESMFGVKLPNQQQYAELMANAQKREAATAQELVEVGKNVVARRGRMQSDPFRRYTERVDISMDGKDPAPATNYAELGANEIGASQGLSFNLGDEVLGLLKGDEARAQRQRLVNYAKDNQPAAFGEGQAVGAGFNALATLPVALPANLNIARALPFGPRTQAVATGALSGALWDTAWQMSENEGSFVDRFKDTDKTQTAMASVIASGVSGLVTALINPVSKEASALSDVLDGVIDTNGAVSPDGLRTLERFLSDMGVPLDDVTLGRINSVIQDYSQAGSKSFTLPMRIKDVLVEALDGGSGKIREAIKSQLRGTQAMGEEGGATIQQSVDEDYAAARQGMYDQYGVRLGQKRRIDSEEGTLAELRKIGEEGYEPILSQGPTTYQGARSLDEVLNGPGMQSGELMTPLKQYANAEGFELVDFIKQNPLKAAHWMQSKARELVDSGQKQYAKLRERLLGAIEDAAPGYNEIRKKYGDEYGNLEALDFGDRFLTNAGKDFEIDKMARAFKELSPAQKRVALLSVRDVLRTATGKGKGTTPPRTSKVGEEQVKEALETVFGARGARVAQDIEKLDDYLYLRTGADIRRRGSQTAPLGEDIKTATTRVQSPFRRKVGNFITGLAGDAALTSTGLPPINVMRRGAVSVGRWVGGDQNRKLNAFATLLEAPIKRAQQRVATQRATPPKGPDGKFISREKAAELGIEVDAPAQTVPAKPAQSGIPALSNPTAQGAIIGGITGGAAPADSNEERLRNMLVGGGLGAVAGRADRGRMMNAAPMGIGGRRRGDIMRDLAKPDAKGQQFPVMRRTRANSALNAFDEYYPNEVSTLKQIQTLSVVAGIPLGAVAATYGYSNMQTLLDDPDGPPLGEILARLEEEVRRREGLPPTPSLKPDSLNAFNQVNP